MSRSSFILVCLLIATSGACEPPARSADNARQPNETLTPITPSALAAFAPLLAEMIPATQRLNEARVTLGRTLYFETVLSDGHDVSCNTCHPLNAWGADGRPVSLGHAGRAGTRNAPTVYNAAGHLAQFWDGRAPDVEAQAVGPILNPVEMAMPDSVAVLAHLRSAPAYVTAFRLAFPEERQPVTYRNVGLAIGAFERRLVTPGRWDAFLAGDSAALSNEERVGLQTFLSTGCQSCHSGAYLGGNSFQKLGAVTPWPSLADSGRILVTRSASDLFVFKVPSLRNIEKTGPYFHDGSVAGLGEAVRLMAHHQLGKELSATQVASIVTWMRVLTGEIPTAYIALPQQPR